MSLAKMQLSRAGLPSLALNTVRLFSANSASLRDYQPSRASQSQNRSRYDNSGDNRYGNRSQNNRYGNNDRYNGNNRRPNNRYNSRDGGNRRNSGGRNYGDDDKIVQRNRSQRHKDDGLRGMEDYAIDKEAIKALTYETLLGESASEEAASGMSPIKTERLSELKVLSLPLVNSLIYNRKYTSLTPVQARTLIPILNNESVVVRAKTGTGKTAAFAIPTIQKVLEAHKEGTDKNKVKAVIISPTRELAQQIADEVSKIVDAGGLDQITVQCFVGGLSKQAQLKQGNLHPDSRGRPCDIVVATPGRLLDILEDDEVLDKFSALTFKVFDEADRLLDIGFERMLSDIRERLNSVTDREVPLLLFSATMDRNVRRFAQAEFGTRVKVVDTVPKNEPTANELVDQTAVVCATWADVYEGVAHRIYEDFEAAKTEGGNFKAIVFMPTVAMVDNYERILKQTFPRDSPLRKLTMGIHGQKTQAARQTRADLFRKMDDAIMITTDVIARGMDFPNVTHVFQVGVPGDVPSYIHRIGRTARIGNTGKSLLFFTNHVRPYLDALARENVKPNMIPYQQNEEFHAKFTEIVTNSVASDVEAGEIINSLMSYMTNLKGKYHIQVNEFMKDMRPFGELYGLEEIQLSRSNSDVWERRAMNHNRRKGFGSSRKTRMRW